MKVIIDRLEGDFAVVETEDKTLVNMPQQLVPVGAGEGSVLSIEIDINETKRRQDIISDLMNKVWDD